jgi:hypothetical protein
MLGGHVANMEAGEAPPPRVEQLPVNYIPNHKNKNDRPIASTANTPLAHRVPTIIATGTQMAP